MEVAILPLEAKLCFSSVRVRVRARIGIRVRIWVRVWVSIRLRAI